jgi:hypothetical protein
MRARQEAARSANRPITVIHALAIACFAGLALSLIETVVAGVRGSAGWLSNVYNSLAALAAPLVSLDLASRWVVLPMTAMAATIVIASIAAYFIFADE